MGGIMSQKGEMGGVLMIQGQIGKSAPESPGNSGVFSILALFFNLSLQKFGQAHPHKIYIFEISRHGAIRSQKFVWLALKL